MFFNELVEDYTFDDIKFVYENDKYFLYVKERYDLSDVDESNFNKLLDSVNHPDFSKKIVSLEVLTVRKSGLLSRVELSDVEGGIREFLSLPLHEITSYPVDMYYSTDNKRALRLIISLLLEFSYYKNLDKSSKKKNI